MVACAKEIENEEKRKTSELYRNINGCSGGHSEIRTPKWQTRWRWCGRATKGASALVGMVASGRAREWNGRNSGRQAESVRLCHSG